MRGVCPPKSIGVWFFGGIFRGVQRGGDDGSRRGKPRARTGFRRDDQRAVAAFDGGRAGVHGARSWIGDREPVQACGVVESNAGFNVGARARIRRLDRDAAGHGLPTARGLNLAALADAHGAAAASTAGKPHRHGRRRSGQAHPDGRSRHDPALSYYERGRSTNFAPACPNRRSAGRADHGLGEPPFGPALETMVIRRPSLTLAAEMLSAAMVLAAGLGTRLRPLTEWCAKPLVPVGDQPALGHVLAQLRAAGIARLVVNAHHRMADVRAFAKSSPDLSVSEEADLLGTAGGVAHAIGQLGGGDVLVYNADTFAQIDLRALADAHAGDGERATLVVRARGPGQGSVGMDENLRLVRIRNERIRTEAYGGDFLGVQVIGAALLRLLPTRGCLVGDTYIPALHRGIDLRAYLHAGLSFDIGTPRGYLDANLAWLAARGTSHWAGAGARIDPQVAVAETIVGAGAAASGHGTICRCVVWPGATARAPLADAVITIENVVLVRGDR